MKTAVNKNLVIVFIIISALFTCSACAKTADDGKIYTVLETTLKTGRYYQDGDVTKPYVEVFPDKTFQWCGMDFEKYVLDAQTGTNENTENFEQVIKEEAERLSSVHKYTIVDYKKIDTIMIAWDWIEESGAAQGFIYIDENTFKFTDNEIFVYVE